MTWLDVALVLVSVFAYGAILGWWAGTRWRRAYNAARYAQIDQRRSAHLLRLLGETQQAMQHAIVDRKPPTCTVQLDYAFAIAALRSNGYDVTPTLKQAELH